MTPDNMARIGRALYGERWQTALATDLQVADRTMRRWLAGEFPIPDGIDGELRKLLVERVKEIGGMIGYSINPTDRSVLHYPSGAFFRYDEAGTLTLLNPQMLAEDAASLVTQGAEEALRQESERDPRIKGMWVDATTGRASPAGNNIELEYKGCVISYPRIPMLSGQWTVNLASNNPHLLAKLGGCVVINDHGSIDGAIAKAKRHVDELV
jgi:hypothetical protein